MQPFVKSKVQFLLFKVGNIGFLLLTVLDLNKLGKITSNSRCKCTKYTM